MPVFVPIKLVCDHHNFMTSACKETVDATAPLTGKTIQKARINLGEATEPEGWTITMEDPSSGYGTPYSPELRCYCPKHTKEREKNR